MSSPTLTLHVPASSHAGLNKELPPETHPAQPLRELHFDTPDRALARAGISLRLHQEDGQWIQALDVTEDAQASDAPPACTALCHDRPGPILDLSLYTDTPVAADLTRLQAALAVRQDIQLIRRLRRVRTRQGTIDIAFDQGRLCAADLELPLSDITLTLVSGRPEAIFALGQRWQHKHGLILELRSRHERCEALSDTARRIAAAGSADSPDAVEARASEIARFWAPRPIQSIRLSAEQSPTQALRAITRECLEQIARNAAILAEIDTAGVYPAGGPEHVHQLRVGLRRLRSAWQLFRDWTALPSAPLQQTAREVFSLFGMSRDDDVLRGDILPALEAAGMPAVTLPPSGTAPSARDMAGGKALQGWLVDMLAWTSGLSLSTAPAETVTRVRQTQGHDTGTLPDRDAATIAIIPMHAVPADNLRTLMTQRLRKWHRGVVRDGQDFAGLEIEARHTLRKRAKRLRYGLAFAESLLPVGKLRGYRRRLADVQDVLGGMNDLYVADARFAELVTEQPQAWFARGWLSARLQDSEQEAGKVLKALGRGDGFW